MKRLRLIVDLDRARHYVELDLEGPLVEDASRAAVQAIFKVINRESGDLVPSTRSRTSTGEIAAGDVESPPLDKGGRS